MKLRPILILLTLLASIIGSPTTILAQAKKPNILAKTALFADNPMSFGVAHSYELLMCDAMIEVRAFKERRAAAQWLEVPLKTLECPS